MGYARGRLDRTPTGLIARPVPGNRRLVAAVACACLLFVTAIVRLAHDHEARIARRSREAMRAPNPVAQIGRDLLAFVPFGTSRR